MNAVMEYSVTDEAHERTSYYMTIWVEWYSSDSNRLGYPTKAVLCRTTGAHWSSDDQCAQLDDAAALAADAVLHDLPPQLGLALMNKYLASVIRARVDRLEAAEYAFWRAMQARGFP